MDKNDAQSPASQRKGPGSIPGQSMRDLWVTDWHWDRFFSECFGFPLSVLFHQWFILIFVYTFLLPGQRGEAWETRQKQYSSRNREEFIEKFFRFRLYFIISA